MAPGVSEDILLVEHESGFKAFFHVRFSRKSLLKSLKIPFFFFGNFREIVELNIGVLEPTLLLEIDN